MRRRAPEVFDRGWKVWYGPQTQVINGPDEVRKEASLAEGKVQAEIVYCVP